MQLNIRDPAVSELAAELARRLGRTKTEAVRRALENELRRLDEAVPLRERIRPIQARILACTPTGLEADKAFYDSLDEDL